MIALLGAGLETRPSACLMRKGYRRPWAPQDRIEIARKYAPGFRREDGLWGNLLKSLMDDRGIPFSFRTRSAVGESALCVAGQSILTGLPLFLTLE